MSSARSLRPFASGLKRLQLDAAARAAALQAAPGEFDYLKQQGASSLVDRLDEVTVPFKRVVDLGAHEGVFAKMLAQSPDARLCRNFATMESFTQLCVTERQAREASQVQLPGSSAQPTALVWDNEKPVPMADASADLVVSSMALHWVNDLPSLLKDVVRVLQPEGCFMGLMLGGDTLHELNVAFAFAEQERRGGLSAHVSPMLRTADACGLLGSAGLKMVTVDSQRIEVEYANAFACMRHLWMLGESHAALTRAPAVARETLMAAAAAMQYLYGAPDGGVPVTFEFVCMIGWKDGAGLARPLAPGSLDHVSLAELGKGYSG